MSPTTKSPRKRPLNEMNNNNTGPTKEAASSSSTSWDEEVPQQYCFHVMSSSTPFSGPILFSNPKDFQKFVYWCDFAMGGSTLEEKGFDTLRDAMQHFAFLVIKKQKDEATATASSAAASSSTTTTATTATQPITTGTGTPMGPSSIQQQSPNSKQSATSSNKKQKATTTTATTSPPPTTRVSPTITNTASSTGSRSMSNMKPSPTPVAYRPSPPRLGGKSRSTTKTSRAAKTAVAAAARRGPPVFQPFPPSYHGGPPVPLPYNGPRPRHGHGPPPPPHWYPLSYAYPPVPPPTKLTAEEQKKMNFDKEFDRKIVLLTDFKNDYGDTDVPHKNVEGLYMTTKGQVLDMTGKYMSLGVWVSRVRIQMKIYLASRAQSLLSDTQAAQLKALSFCMESKRNEEIKSLWKPVQYQKLITFYQEHGHSDPRHSDNPSLSIWCSSLRKAYRLKQQGKFSNLTDDHISKLKEVDFDFTIQRGVVLFDEREAQWLTYRAQNQGKDPSNTKQPFNKWMTQIRREYAKKKEGQPYLDTVLTDERIERLTRLGFIWESKYKQAPKLHKPKTLDERIQELLEYKKRYGDCLVPQAFPSLGMWVAKQRQDFNKRINGIKSRMTDEKLQKLKDIGFVFDKQADGPRFLKATGELQVLKTRGLVAKKRELIRNVLQKNNPDGGESGTNGKDLVTTVLDSTTEESTGVGIGQILAAAQTNNNGTSQQSSDETAAAAAAAAAQHDEDDDDDENDDEDSVVSASDDSTSEDSLEDFTAQWM